MVYDVPPPPRDHGLGGHNADIYPVDDRYDQYADLGSGGRHNDIGGLEALLADTNIGTGTANKKNNKKGVSYLDDDLKDKKTTLSKPVEVKLEGFVLTKITPPNGEKPVWSKVGSRPIPLDDVKLEAMARKHLQRSGISAGAYFTKELSTEQQGIIDRLINQKTLRERETNVEWVLYDVAKVDEWVKANFFQENRVTTKLRVIIRRQAVKSSTPRKPNTSAVYDYSEIIDLSVPLNAKDGKKDGKLGKANNNKQQVDLDDDFLAGLMDVPAAKPKKKGKKQPEYQDDFLDVDQLAGYGNQHNSRQDNYAHHGDGYGAQNYNQHGAQNYDQHGAQNYNQQPYVQQPLHNDQYANVPGAIPANDYDARHHNVPPVVPMPPTLNPFQPEVGAQAVYDQYGANNYEPYGTAHITTRPRSQSRIRREDREREEERRRSQSRRRREDERDRALKKEIRKVRNELRNEVADVKDKVEGWNVGSGSSEGSYRDDVWTPPRSPRYSSPATSPDRDARRPAGSLHRRGSKDYRREPKYYKDHRDRRYEITPGVGYRDDRDRGRRQLSDFSPQARPRLIHAATYDDYPPQPRYAPAARRLTDYADAMPEAEFVRVGRGVDYLRADPRQGGRSYEYEGLGRRNMLADLEIMSADMATPSTTFLDLPIDIILLLLPYLDAASFLSLTSTCTALHSPDLLHDPTYWSHLVRNTFRVPNQPVVQTNGHRWQKLYKRLFTQSRVMTWGDNDKACLGHSFASRAELAAIPPGLRRQRQLRMRHVSWPGAMAGTEGLGVISDLQCGGWSTTLLTAKGALYTVGVMDGLQFNQRRPPFVQATKPELTALRFPSGFVQPQQRYDEATAVAQFSAGRGHVLALSDSGRIWSWQNIEHAGLQVRFIEHDTNGAGGPSGRGVVKKVVAGWNKSAALIEGSGIVVWEPLQREEEDVETEDTALVLESVAVPKTNWRKTKSGRDSGTDDASLAKTVGEVINFVVLEAVVLFNTSLGKLFVSQITWTDDSQSISEPLEIPLTTSEDPDEAFATDVQGSFHNFAVFTRSGAVLTAHQDRVMNLLQDQNPDREIFKRIPALQHRDVISVAFGDYHFHALHAPGYITSYGQEPQACGALGLGGHGDPEGRLRGIRYQAMGGDGRLVPHAYTEGRRVWFEHEKRQWITFLTSGGANAEEAAERLRMAIGSPDLAGQGEVSEWVEQEGRDWEEKFGLQDEDEDGLGAYFALSVTAAGWHSGALVLVNDQLAKKVAKACEVPAATNDEPTKVAEDETAETDEAETSDSTTSSSEPNNVSLLTRALTLTSDYAQWFLGVSTYSVSSNTTAQGLPHPGVHRPPTFGYPQTAVRHPPTPVDYGASPREGVDYVWVKDHFPRLRLSDGREMPGEVEFSEWRYGRPEWDLEFQP